ncbi:ABC transporter permease [Bacillus sp. Marseille-Q1617]|uniref:ABC transporter permease n=1 Tax=Bacillus sp. Marseille-Q1617 TaxID=2736887 RepID=UPI001588CE27|nr:ABC transporter permease [Bacillus sp. Marseille-Q1617]
MRASTLFRRRLAAEWNYQWGVMKSVLDWTIVVYLVIPVLIAAPFLYADMWEHSELYWSGRLPFHVLFVLILFVTASGNFRTYLMEADLLYLLQQKDLLYPFKRYSFLYSVVDSVIRVLAAGVIAMPLFAGIYGLQVSEVYPLMAAVLAVRLLFMTVKKFTSKGTVKLAAFVLLAAAAAVLVTNGGSFAAGVIGLSMAAAVIFHHLWQMPRTDRWFMKEIEIEGRERVRYIKLILTYSMEVEKEPENQKSRPLHVFRDSQRLFKGRRSKEDGLLELLVKGFLRRNYLTLYIQVFLLTMSAVIILPIWLKWIVFAGFAFFIQSWLKSLFRKMLDSPFFAVVPYDKEAVDSVWIRFKKLFALPVIGAAGASAVFITIVEVIGRIG